MAGATALWHAVDMGGSGPRRLSAGLYRHGLLGGLTLMRALRRALAAACLIVSVIAGGNAMAASGDLLDAIEYYYPKLDHYFVTADAHEISALDAGMFPRLAANRLEFQGSRSRHRRRQRLASVPVLRQPRGRA